MKEYKIEIAFVENGIPQTFIFNKACSTLDELKEAFLKRFGNIKDAPNSVLRDKSKVKDLTREATTIEEWMQSVNLKTRWTLNIKTLGY